ACGRRGAPLARSGRACTDRTAKRAGPSGVLGRWSFVICTSSLAPRPLSLAVADRTWFSDKGRGARDKGRIHGPGRRSVPVLSRHAAEAGELRAARAAAGGEPDVAVRRGRHGLRLVHPVPEADSPAGGRRRGDGVGTADAGGV